MHLYISMQHLQCTKFDYHFSAIPKCLHPVIYASPWFNAGSKVKIKQPKTLKKKAGAKRIKFEFIMQ